MKKKNFILAILILASPLFIFGTALGTGEGTTGAVILTQPIGARAVAMGEAYTAISGDVCGLYYNPAAISGLIKRQVSFHFHTGFAGDNFSTIIFGSATNIGTFAASLLYYTVGDMELIDTYGNSRTINAQQDYVLTLSFSRSLIGKALYFGTNAKLLRSTIIEQSATAFAVDFGILWALMNEKLAVGLSVRNIGTELKYLEEKTPLPLALRGGVSYKLQLTGDSYGIMAVDIVRVTETIKANLGLEYSHKGFLAIRTGCELGDGFESLTSGLGFIVKKTELDYSLKTMGDLGLTHRMSLKYNF